MKLEEALDNFRKGKFESDFIKISLQQLGGAKPKEFSGPGSLRQDEQGQIVMKCYAAASTMDMAVDYFNDQMNRQSGDLYLDEDYYHMDAIHISAGKWSSERTLINTSWSMSHNAGSVTAKLHSLRYENKKSTSSKVQLRLYFFAQKTRDWKCLIGVTHSFEIARQEFTLIVVNDLDDQILLTITSKTELPEAFERRLLEALQFLLCIELHPAISDITNNFSRVVEFRSASTGRASNTVLPPIPTSSTYFSSAIIRLLGDYLRHLYRTTDEGIWHPLSNFLALSRNASGLSLDAWAIGLCVAIEGVAGEIIYNAVDNSDYHTKVRDGIINWMDQEDVSESLKNRIKGFLSQLDHIRPQDRMLSLVKSGNLREVDINSWKKLRNRSVHTRRTGKVDLEDSKLQESIDDTYRVLGLLYMLVFYQIGYVGPCTDYSMRGWPEFSYPPTLKT